MISKKLTSRRSLRPLYFCVFFGLLLQNPLTLHAANSDWNAGACGTTWSIGGNWAGGVPGNNDAARFLCVGSPTINLGGVSNRMESFQVDEATNSSTFTFQSGTVRIQVCCCPGPAPRVDNGIVIFNLGGKLNHTTQTFSLATTAGDMGTLIFDGATSSFTSTQRVEIGDAGSGTLIFRNCATGSLTGNSSCVSVFIGNTATGAGTMIIESGACVTVLRELRVGQSGTGYLGITCATLNTKEIGGGIGAAATGTMVFTNATITICNDIDVSRAGTGYMTAINTNFTLGATLRIGLFNGGDATAYISGGTMTAGAMTIADWRCSSPGCQGSGHFTVTGGACITISGASSCTKIGSSGKGKHAELHVDCAAVLTLNDPCDIQTGQDSLIELGGGTIKGSADFQFECCAIIRGNGRIDNCIDLQGGTFGKCNGNAADVLYLGGVLMGPCDTVVMEGPGTIVLENAGNTFTGNITISDGTVALGGTGVIPDANSITLSGGTFSTGVTTGYTETVTSLTLSTNSTINLGTGVHTLTLSDDLLLGGNTLTVIGWAGTAGSSGTAADC